MLKKHLSYLLLVGLLFLSFSLLGHCQNQTADSILKGWQVEYTGDNGVGYFSESNGVFRLWGNGGGITHCPTVALYKPVKVTSDFTFSAEVNAKTIESCALVLRGSLPIAGSTDGCNFEFGYYGQGDFLLARNCSDWAPTFITYGTENKWYTMQLNVSSSPFLVTASVIDENGILIGSYSTNFITGFSFNDIHYIGFVVWGFSPADYSFRNLQDTFHHPSTLSISTQSSATTTGAIVNVFGTLIDLSGLPIQNQTVVLSYAISGVTPWVPVGSAQTDEQGNYLIQWVNSASGTFTLKAEWNGDATNAFVSNTTTLSFLPSQRSTFIIESNSTVNQIMFDNTTATLSFNVTGPFGTEGFVKTTIAKSLLANSTDLQAYLDYQPLNFTVASVGDSWVFTFNYSHSTHKVSVHLTEVVSSPEALGSNLLLIGIIIVLLACLALGIFSWHRLSHNQRDIV